MISYALPLFNTRMQHLRTPHNGTLHRSTGHWCAVIQYTVDQLLSFHEPTKAGLKLEVLANLLCTDSQTPENSYMLDMDAIHRDWQASIPRRNQAAGFRAGRGRGRGGGGFDDPRSNGVFGARGGFEDRGPGQGGAFGRGKEHISAEFGEEQHRTGGAFAVS